MNEIKVNKTQLIEIMRRNRDAHHDIVVEAQDGFRQAVIKRLDEMLERARDGKRIDINVGLQMPQDHTEEYDTVIGMLDLDIEETVMLDYSQYKMWVEDDWGWSRQFTTANATYSATAASLL